MNLRSTRMSLAANIGMSRLHCRKCGPERIHIQQACIHCGALYQVAAPPSLLSPAELRAQINERNYILAQARKRGQKRMNVKGG